VPGFLLHLAPQVALHDTTATDFLDHRNGIVRDRPYVAERRFAAWTSKRERAYVEAEWQRFTQSRYEQTLTAFGDKVKQLPMRDGDVDLGALGVTASELGHRMAAEFIPPFDVLLESFMREVEQRETAQRAYFRWLNGGQEHGHDLEDWFVAEGTLRGC
jgi:hypothetical protein